MDRHDNRTAQSCVLLIGGLDPSGGAGLATDQRACSLAGAWPLPVASLITVQSTAGLVSTHPLPPSLVVDQARRVWRDQNVSAIKLGALGSRDVIEAVSSLLEEWHNTVPVVMDPVIGATRGNDGLVSSDALDALRYLAQRCTVLTPNRDEASALSGIDIMDARSALDAATVLQHRGPRAVLLKGGHMDGPKAIDWLVTDTMTTQLTSPRLDVPPFHGSGCAMASLLAGRLATLGTSNPSDQQLEQAARFAKDRMFQQLQRLRVVGKGLRVLPLDS